MQVVLRWVLTLLAAVLFALGWTAGALVTAMGWSATAIRVGWSEGRQKGGS